MRSLESNDEEDKILLEDVPKRDIIAALEKETQATTFNSFLLNSLASFMTVSNYNISMFYMRILVSAHCPVYYSQSIGYSSGIYGVLNTSLIMGA